MNEKLQFEQKNEKFAQLNVIFGENINLEKTFIVEKEIDKKKNQ